MRVHNINEFALAVVQSSDPKLSVDEKLALYLEASEKAQEHNKNNPVKGSVKSFE
ncbi:MAG: hypothetical protein ACLTPR_07725 [Enterococcus canintestini]|uniref:hypothetical protein n=1 Tax=Enterococcus canintestini TaxID=317010 RepID=UPI003993E6C6